MAEVEFVGRFYNSDPQCLGRYEEEEVNRIIGQIKKVSKYHHNVVINVTWLPLDHHGPSPLHDIFKSKNKETTKFWFIGLIDELHSAECFISNYVEQGYKVEFIGNSLPNYDTIFPKILYDFNKHRINQFNLQTIKHVFLSYNRKPQQHRLDLVQGLVKNQLYKYGVVTFQENVFPELDDANRNFDIDFEKKHFLNNNDFHFYNSYGKNEKYSRPEDIISLGNLEIWRQSYCIVVTESFAHVPYQTSEKMWKPIFGMRPFVLVSHPTVLDILTKLDFYTPVDLFKNYNLKKCTANNTINFIRNLTAKSKNELFDLYKSQIDMIEHNHRRFIELATSNKSMLDLLNL